MVEEEEKKEVVHDRHRQDINIKELPALEYEHHPQNNSEAEQK